MCPWWNLPDERLLDGSSLLFDDVVDNSVVKDLLFNYLTPQNARIDLMSSLFGRDGDEDDEPNDDSSEVNEDEYAEDVDVQHDFDIAKAGPPTIEPRFGTKFWEESISGSALQQWSSAAAPQLPPNDLLLDLPPVNPFIPVNLDLKPLPGENDRTFSLTLLLAQHSLIPMLNSCS